uniref:FCH and mu domain containing endocytic adaptor 2 n=1 Tax=Cyprinus carpio carpio TaxID=630221 RepID=A0A8C1CDH7_CYPCA
MLLAYHSTCECLYCIYTVSTYVWPAKYFGDKNNGFDVLYHNMKHGQISSKELSEFIRERATIEEAYSRSMTKLAKTASNCSQLGTFAPMWDVFKQSTEKLAACHMELVRKLQELIKEVQKYVEEQAKNHKKTKEEVASTLEAVQNIQSVSQALQKSKENYISKTLEQERMRKEGATQKDLDKAGLKVKKATETYKSYVEKYATAKTEFEQRMTETSQKFQGIEEEHVLRMQEIIHSYCQSVEETHIQIGEEEFVKNMENTSVESLIQKLAESKGTGKERPGNTAKSLTHKNSFYSSSDSEDEDEPRKFHVQIKPVQTNNGTHQHKATIDELKASIGNISLSPTPAVRDASHQHAHHIFQCLSLQRLSELNHIPPTIIDTYLNVCFFFSFFFSLLFLSLIGTSRGPSPVTLASLDALPIAVAFTESVNAYFKGADPSKCIVKITGDMTLSFPSGIIKIFTSSPSPAVLSFKLSNTSRLEQIMPNQQLLHSDSSQSDTNTKDFWLNMPALTAYLRKSSEQNPAASYYNVDILKYQVCSNGIQSTPLNLVVYWKCTSSTTDLRVDYRYNPEAMQPPAALTNVQVLVPVSGDVTNMQSIPNAIWNAEQSKSLWKLSSGSLRAKFELSDGPSIPATLAVQFFSEGSLLSGVDVELVGSGYRLSLNKKRFATGKNDFRLHQLHYQ